jgi:uncharacterized protein (TIGR03067 family)
MIASIRAAPLSFPPVVAIPDLSPAPRSRKIHFHLKPFAATLLAEKRNRMIRASALFLLALSVQAAAAPARSRQEMTQQDLKHLQGVWKVAAAWQQGKRMPAELYRDAHLVIAGNRIWDRSDGPEHGMSFRLNPWPSPRHIDLKMPTTHKTCPGIYRLSGDRLILCWDGEGSRRPKQFVSPPGSRVYLFELIREQQ